MSISGQALRFKDYVWKSNPETLRLDYERNIKRLPMPYAGESLQDYGNRRRTVTGKGVFWGKDCTASFDRLAAVFREGGGGMLCIPGTAPFRAVFASLQMLGEARPNTVSYSFLFVEDETEVQADGVLQEKDYVCTGGETLWELATRYSTTVDDLLMRNPQVMWPNELPEGMKVALC